MSEVGNLISTVAITVCNMAKQVSELLKLIGMPEDDCIDFRCWEMDWRLALATKLQNLGQKPLLQKSEP